MSARKNLPDTFFREGMVRFGVVFTVLVAIGGVGELYLLRYQARTQGGAAYQKLIAGVVGGGLWAVGVPARVSGTAIRINSASVEVAVECTGIQATAIFLAGVLAFPCSWRQRSLGVLIGLFGVSMLNIGRITALALVAGYRNDWFDQVHTVLMQGFLILFVAPLWVMWMVYANRSARVTNRSKRVTT